MLQLLLPLLAAAEEPLEFAAPELLLADGQPVNAVEGMPYPSPVLIDVDRDGRDELVAVSSLDATPPYAALQQYLKLEPDAFKRPANAAPLLNDPTSNLDGERKLTRSRTKPLH